MELAAVSKATTRTTGASKRCSRTAKLSSSWGLSRHVGVRVLLHRDLTTCRFLRSLPGSWLKKYWGRLGKKSNKQPPTSTSSSPPRPTSRSLPSICVPAAPSSGSSRFLLSPASPCFSSPASKEREHSGQASSQPLDGHPGFHSTPGMTVSLWGPSSQSATAASVLGHSLRHHNSSG